MKCKPRNQGITFWISKCKLGLNFSSNTWKDSNPKIVILKYTMIMKVKLSTVMLCKRAIKSKIISPRLSRLFWVHDRAVRNYHYIDAVMYISLAFFEGCEKMTNMSANQRNWTGCLCGYCAESKKKRRRDTILCLRLSLWMTPKDEVLPFFYTILLVFPQTSNEKKQLNWCVGLGQGHTLR